MIIVWILLGLIYFYGIVFTFNMINGFIGGYNGNRDFYSALISCIFFWPLILLVMLSKPGYKVGRYLHAR